MYVIKNYNETDDVAEINIDKEFLTVDESYAVAAADDAGTPGGDITGS